MTCPAPTMTACITVGPGRRLRDGYVQVYRNGKRVMRHRAAWEDANGPVPAGYYVCHRCDNPACWHLDHLFLGTPSDNAIDRESKGRGADNRGERHGHARLTEAMVCLVRQRYSGGELQREIAADLGVRQAHVSRIVRREAWKSHACEECAE